MSEANTGIVSAYVKDAYNLIIEVQFASHIQACSALVRWLESGKKGAAPVVLGPKIIPVSKSAQGKTVFSIFDLPFQKEAKDVELGEHLLTLQSRNGGKYEDHDLKIVFSASTVERLNNARRNSTQQMQPEAETQPAAPVIPSPTLPEPSTPPAPSPEPEQPPQPVSTTLVIEEKSTKVAILETTPAPQGKQSTTKRLLAHIVQETPNLRRGLQELAHMGKKAAKKVTRKRLPQPGVKPVRDEDCGPGLQVQLPMDAAGVKIGVQNEKGDDQYLVSENKHATPQKSRTIVLYLKAMAINDKVKLKAGKHPTKVWAYDGESFMDSKPAQVVLDLTKADIAFLTGEELPPAEVPPAAPAPAAIVETTTPVVETVAPVTETAALASLPAAEETVSSESVAPAASIPETAAPASEAAPASTAKPAELEPVAEIVDSRPPLGTNLGDEAQKAIDASAAEKAKIVKPIPVITVPQAPKARVVIPAAQKLSVRSRSFDFLALPAANSYRVNMLKADEVVYTSTRTIGTVTAPIAIGEHFDPQCVLPGAFVEPDDILRLEVIMMAEEKGLFVDSKPTVKDFKLPADVIAELGLQKVQPQETSTTTSVETVIPVSEKTKIVSPAAGSPGDPAAPAASATVTVDHTPITAALPAAPKGAEVELSELDKILLKVNNGKNPLKPGASESTKVATITLLQTEKVHEGVSQVGSKVDGARQDIAGAKTAIMEKLTTLAWPKPPGSTVREVTSGGNEFGGFLKFLAVVLVTLMVVFVLWFLASKVDWNTRSNVVSDATSTGSSNNGNSQQPPVIINFQPAVPIIMDGGSTRWNENAADKAKKPQGQQSSQESGGAKAQLMAYNTVIQDVSSQTTTMDHRVQYQEPVVAVNPFQMGYGGQQVYYGGVQVQGRIFGGGRGHHGGGDNLPAIPPPLPPECRTEGYKFDAWARHSESARGNPRIDNGRGRGRRS